VSAHFGADESFDFRFKFGITYAVVCELDDGRDGLAPNLVGQTDDGTVGNLGR
jgi:hypothetical protein